MGVLEQYQGASWRGVTFLVPREDESGGQKSVSHEYPNSDERFVEQLGRMPAIFKMEGTVHGDDAIQQRIRLKEALDTPGLGDLIHPIYGTVRVKALPYSIRSTQTRMGEFIFSLEFARSKENVSPSPDTLTSQSVTQIALATAEAIAVALEVNYVEPKKGDLLDSSANKVISVTDDVNSKVNSVTGLESDTLSTFNRTSKAITNTAFRIAQTPTDISNSMSALYRTALEVVDTPDKLSDAWKALLDNVEAITNPTDTVARKNRVTNLNLFDEYARMNALLNLYEAESYKDFATTAELDEALALLESKFQEYIEDAVTVTEDAGIASMTADPTVRQTFLNLRNTFNEVMNTKEQNLWRVVTISPGQSSMSLTAYKYYGNLDNLDLIKDLNTGVNVGLFNETELQAVSK